ncbi:MAG: nucleotidyltransferase family protein [Magnetococcales bacterium]|nr:nucleotidyltransferase family protein [Magnetococcales bacterium]
MKGLILAGGRGSRLKERTVNTNKCMLSFKGKPLISYSLDCAISTGLTEIIIVVGYRAEDIINQFGIHYQGAKIQYVIQQERKGLVHAIETASEALDGADFMTFLGDEVMHGARHKEMLDYFQDNNLFSVCGVTIPKDRSEVSKTYGILQGEDNKIFRLIEKPPRPLNNIQGTGNCLFRNGILEFIPYTPISHQRTEKEFPDLIQCAIDAGHDVRSFSIGTSYKNINTQSEIQYSEENI